PRSLARGARGDLGPAGRAPLPQHARRPRPRGKPRGARADRGQRARARVIPAASPEGPPVSRVLFFTSNGTGLGHLTRSMAIARRLDGRLEPLVFTLSAAAPVVREQGFPVEFCASYRTPCAGTEWRWSRRLRGRARAAIAEAKPALVVFGGADPYLGFLDALRAERGPRSVWCRRAMWKPGANVAALPRARAFDAVLEPGELAAAEDR